MNQTWFNTLDWSKIGKLAVKSNDRSVKQSAGKSVGFVADSNPYLFLKILFILESWIKELDI